MAIGFARFWVRDVNFNAGQANGFERIEKRKRCVRVGASVQQNAIEGAAGRANAIDQSAFMIRLKGVDIDAKFASSQNKLRVNVLKRNFAVNCRFARAEKLKVRPRKHENFMLCRQVRVPP